MTKTSIAGIDLCDADLIVTRSVYHRSTRTSGRQSTSVVVQRTGRPGFLVGGEVCRRPDGQPRLGRISSSVAGVSIPDMAAEEQAGSQLMMLNGDNALLCWPRLNYVL